jgi:predicted DCC family thiol-disulfide oxidoreductase YuxK
MSAQAGPPILVFDGDCGFCTSSARFLARWVARTGPAPAAPPARLSAEPTIEPYQHLNLADLGLTADQCRAAVQWVGRDGQVASGHRAIAAALRAGHLVWRPLGALLVAPGISWLAGRLYSWVADHRYALPGGTPACRNDDPNPPG